MSEKLDCDECREAYSKFNKGEPNCAECLPSVWPENMTALNIYLKVHNQHIMGFSGPVDLNLESLLRVMSLYDIKDPRRCYESVHRAYTEVRKHIYKKEQQGKATKG